MDNKFFLLIALSIIGLMLANDALKLPTIPVDYIFICKDQKMKYEEFVQKIRSFERNSILLLTVEQCWTAFSDEKYRLTLTSETVLSRIFAISMATGNNHRSKKITPAELQSLCADYFFIENGYSYEPNDLDLKNLLERKIKDQKFHAQQVAQLTQALKELENISKYDIPEDIIEKSIQAFVLQRELGAQYEDPKASVRAMARSWAILKQLDLDNPTMNIMHLFEKKQGLNPFAVISSAMALLSAARRWTTQGFLCIENIDFEASLAARVGIDQSTLRKTIEGLTSSTENYRAWHEEVVTKPPYIKQYTPNFLYESPLINANVLFLTPPQKTGCLCPSPSIFLHYASAILLGHFNKLSDKMGPAYEKYLDSILDSIFPGSQKIKIDDTEDKSQKADFIVETSNATWVIECKKTIGSKNLRTIALPEDIAFSWDRLVGACEQCASTIKKIKKSDEIKKPIISIILVTNTIILEGAVFQNMAAHSRALDRLGLQYVEVFSLDTFERTFIMMEEEKIIAAIQQKWERVRRGDWVFEDILDIGPLKAEADIPSEFPHLTPHYNEIMPYGD